MEQWLSENWPTAAAVVRWLTDHWQALAIGSAVMFVGSLVGAAVVLIRLPHNYFVEDHPAHALAEGLPILRWAGLIFKNLLGAVLLLAGIIMCFTPGQGILMILIGVMLLNFPGKRALERKLVGRPRVLQAINRLRARFGRPALVLDQELRAAIRQAGEPVAAAPPGPPQDGLR